jgi:uncharacterized membrane protein
MTDETARVTRFSVALLSIEWILFDSWHFAIKGLTEAELPKWFPLRPQIVTVSGMIEVAIGILILLPATTRVYLSGWFEPDARSASASPPYE